MQRFLTLKKEGPITFSEVLAYQQLYGIELSPMEISAIMAMDRGYSVGVAEALKESGGG